jgi:hypothetical protein
VGGLHCHIHPDQREDHQGAVVAVISNGEHIFLVVTFRICAALASVYPSEDQQRLCGPQICQAKRSCI